MLKKRRHRVTRKRLALTGLVALTVTCALGYVLVRQTAAVDRLTAFDRAYATAGYAAGERNLIAHLKTHPKDREAWHLLIERRGGWKYWQRALDVAQENDANGDIATALSAPPGAHDMGLSDAAFSQVLQQCPVMPLHVGQAWLALFSTEKLEAGLDMLFVSGPPDPNDFADAGEMALAMDQNQRALTFLLLAESVFPRDDVVNSDIIEVLSRLHLRERLSNRLRDPHLRTLASETALIDDYLHRRDIPGLVVHLTVSDYKKFTADVLFAVSMCGLGWLFFLTVLGGVEDWPMRRRLFALVALLLGMASAMVTLAVAVIQDDVFSSPGPGAQWGPQLLYFIFSVGFREELLKLALFVPLAPLLQKASRSEALTLAAMVGLGFAIQENAAYFVVDTGAVMGRFLTANFFHLSMTGLIGASFVDALKDGGEKWMTFTRTFFLIVVLHGAYDFLLTGAGDIGPYLAMTVLIYVAQWFLRECASAQTTYRSRFPTTWAFTVALGMAMGATFAVAEFYLGFTFAARALFTALLANVFIAYMFYREFIDEIDV